MSAVKATHKGLLFEGLVDCYVLESGQRVISQRGVVRALTGDANGSAPLGPYLARLPSNYANLATQTEITFCRPEGGTAKGRDARWLVELLRAYSEADDADELHHTQRHLAKNARKILLTLAEVGIVAMIDEATGYQQIREHQELRDIFRLFLAEKTSDWELTWNQALVAELCHLYGNRYDGGTHPRWLASINQKLYRTLFSEDLYRELKARNEEPHRGSNHHQWLTPEAKKYLKLELDTVRRIARQASSVADFWQRLRYEYKKEPLQLSWLGPHKRRGRS